MRLIEAAERLFIRKGFDVTSVDDISETAGYSRGAFYSNFEDKEQVFLAVVERRRPQLLSELDDIFQQVSDPALRIAAVRDWFSNLWRLKDFTAIQLEFSRRAITDRVVRKRLAEIRQQELETYTHWVGRCFSSTDAAPADRPEIVALVLFALAQGLGTLGINTDPEWEHMYIEAARLIFDRVTAFQNS
jgi:AcrR family transcriptional regulator